MKPIPMLRKFVWKGDNINGVTMRGGPETGLCGFDVQSLLDIPGVQNFLRMIHISRFEAKQPEVLFAVDASDDYVNIYLSNNIGTYFDNYIPFAYMRLKKNKPNQHSRYAKQISKWKLYDSGVYD